MKKVDEMKMNGNFVKYYQSGFGNINPIDIFNQLIENGIEISNVRLEEDAEFDMKMHAGNYSFDKFCDIYPSLAKSGPNYLISTEVIYEGSQVYIKINDGTSVMYIETKNKDIELTDMMEKKTLRF